MIEPARKLSRPSSEAGGLDDDEVWALLDDPACDAVVAAGEVALRVRVSDEQPLPELCEVGEQADDEVALAYATAAEGGGPRRGLLLGGQLPFCACCGGPMAAAQCPVCGEPEATLTWEATEASRKTLGAMLVLAPIPGFVAIAIWAVASTPLLHGDSDALLLSGLGMGVTLVGTLALARQLSELWKVQSYDISARGGAFGGQVEVLDGEVIAGEVRGGASLPLRRGGPLAACLLSSERALKGHGEALFEALLARGPLCEVGAKVPRARRGAAALLLATLLTMSARGEIRVVRDVQLRASLRRDDATGQLWVGKQLELSGVWCEGGASDDARGGLEAVIGRAGEVDEGGFAGPYRRADVGPSSWRLSLREVLARALASPALSASSCAADCTLSVDVVCALRELCEGDPEGASAVLSEIAAVLRDEG